jgi:hypothetical protein
MLACARILLFFRLHQRLHARRYWSIQYRRAELTTKNARDKQDRHKITVAAADN